MSQTSIHQGQPLLTIGTRLQEARAAVILLHGRGGTARSILGLTEELPGEGIAYVAPQAAGNTWYPNSGFLPMEANEPYISSAFAMLEAIVVGAIEEGYPSDRMVIGGFSQGACLGAEFVARHPQRYGGVFALSGALLGPAEAPRSYPGSLDGTPVYIAGATSDSWVTEEQLRLTANVFAELGGDVALDITPSREHAVRPHEVAAVRRMLENLIAAP